MTKAKAKARARARAAAKAKNPVAKGGKSEAKVKAGLIDAKSNTMRNIGGGANIKTRPATTHRAARSR